MMLFNYCLTYFETKDVKNEDYVVIELLIYIIYNMSIKTIY